MLTIKIDKGKMEEKNIISILEYIVSMGLDAIKVNTDLGSLPLDYVAIFSKNEREFDDLKNFI